jgi:hypothetical protein
MTFSVVMKVCEGLLHLRKKRSKTNTTRKEVERDAVWSRPCEMLKLPQRRHRDHNCVVQNSNKQIMEYSLWFGLLIDFKLLFAHLD